MHTNLPKLLRITTVPISFKLLLTGQMKFMSQHEFEVVMVSSDGDERKEIIASEGCEHIIVPFTRKITPFQDLKALWKLIRIIRRVKPDIVHTHTPKAGLLGMLAAKICGVKVKVHTIAGLPFMTAKGSKKKLLMTMERLTYYAADWVLPNSNSIRFLIAEEKMLPESKIDMIGFGSSNGINLERYSRNALDSKMLLKVKNSISYDNKFKWVLCVGRVVRDKGIVELVSAFKNLLEEKDNIKLLIVGPIEKERQEELLPAAILKEIQSNPNIIHVNWSDQVEYYMEIATLLVHASYREGFPNVPLQAGAMECPVICSRIPGNIDIVKNGQTGIYFEPKSTADLQEKLGFALNNETQLSEYSRSLRKEVELKYSRKFIHSEILKFYQSKIN